MVEDTEARIATVRDAHPEWLGATFTFSPISAGVELHTVSSQGDMSASILEDLGLRLSPAVAALAPSATPGRAVIAAERVDLLDADVMLVTYFGEGAPEVLRGSPLFERLPAVERGSFVEVDNAVAIGLAFPSVLSLPFALERIVPQLEQALGDR